MSLNRSEQQICDYVDSHPEELRFWQDKVKSVAAAEPDRHQAAADLAEQLVAYTVERAAVVPALRELQTDPMNVIVSMRNLAEYWLRLWAPPPPKKKNESFV
jgi:hypothetical protein